MSCSHGPPAAHPRPTWPRRRCSPPHQQQQHAPPPSRAAAAATPPLLPPRLQVPHAEAMAKVREQTALMREHRLRAELTARLGRPPTTHELLARATGGPPTADMVAQEML